ncbi:hypothetical protein ACOSP7_020035 [Xanthoceras sorbifolium]
MVELASFSFERSLNELEAFQVGPYGLKRGREWSYIAKGAITGIMISCDDTAVVSYVFKGVDENGNVEYSDTFGYHYEDVTKIMLEWPQEYFTSLSGTYYEGFSNYYFSSLCFTTNRKKYGPFGYVTGTPFDFPTNGRVIVGFYGSVLSGEYHWTYGTLGVYVKHSTHLFGPSSQVQLIEPKTEVIRSDFNKQECIKVGPWGWSRSITEKEWSYMLKGGAITEMKIGYNRDSIKWIAFKSLDENADQEVKSSQKSITLDEKHEVIPLNWPKEYLVSISGTLRASIGDIESLCFYTNRTIYGPFGTMEGTPFSFNMKGGIIVGFYGRVGDYFDALGAYIKPFSEFFGSLGQGQIENTRVEARTYGGRGGKEWVYKPNNGAITEIKITHSRSIDSLYFKSVDENKNSGYSDEFDDEGGDTFLIKID